MEFFASLRRSRMTAMQIWPAYLINLAENTARLANSGAQLEAQNISFERFDAVNGRKLSDDEISSVYDSRANRRYARAPLLRTEVGCYLSHIRVWERIAKSDADGGIVFEDDFHANDGLAEVLETLSRHLHDFDMVKLYSPKPHRASFDRRLLDPEHQLVAPYRIPNCTIAYILKKSAAQRLAMQAIPFFRAVDEDLKWFWEKNLQVGLVLPLPIGLGNQESALGTIGGERSAVRKRRKFWSRIARSSRVLSYSVRYESLLHFHRARKWLGLWT